MPKPRCEHLLKKSKRKAKAGRAVTRTLADGSVKTYRYGAYKAPVTRVAPDSIEVLIRAYKQSPEWNALSKSTKTTRECYIRELLEIGHIRVKDVTRRLLLEIRDAIAAKRGNGAADNFKQAASVLFKWAVDRNWIEHSPVLQVKKLSSGHLPAWTAEQAVAALSGLRENLRRVVVLGLYTGQRRGDLCAVKWSDYDGEAIRFVQHKTGADIAVRVTPDLKAELDAWRAGATAETILTNDWGKPWLPNTLSISIPRAFRTLDLPPGLNMHGMRKLFAAGMAANGASAHEIGANTGHQTLAMVQLYTRSADQRKLSEGAVGKIQSFTNVAKSDKRD
jgi:integrase